MDLRFVERHDFFAIPDQIHPESGTNEFKKVPANFNESHLP